MNLTIVVDDDILKRARIRAIQEDTSVSAVLRQYLTAYARYVGEDLRRERACQRSLALSQSRGLRRAGKMWTRDALHER